MHPLIDPRMVESIRTTGKTRAEIPDRKEILKAHDLPYDQPADHVVITGCQILSALPGSLATLSRLLDRGGMRHTFLSEEFCCGNYLYRPAIKAKDNDALEECRELSKEFVQKNLKLAENLGAGRIIIFCSPCYPVYKNAFPDEDIVFYPRALTEVLEPLSFQGEVDYYPGCYRLHKKFADVPMDLAATTEVFAQFNGLQVNRIPSPKCCFHPEGLKHMIESIRNDTMVHVCTGCFVQAKTNKPASVDTQILMLPDFVEMALKR